MNPHDAAKAYIVASAELGALIEASLVACDLAQRRSAAGMAERLRGYAEELAPSPAGRDQVLRLALLAAAADLEDDRLLGGVRGLVNLHSEPDTGARRGVRAAAVAAPFVSRAEAQRVADDLERRHRPEARDARDLAERLTSEAGLHSLLWDDPRLACHTETRCAMRASIRPLLERAGSLSPADPARRPDDGPTRRRDLLNRAAARWRLAIAAVVVMAAPWSRLLEAA
jgi:hypothetical protein